MGGAARATHEHAATADSQLPLRNICFHRRVPVREVTQMFKNNVKTVVLLTALGALFIGVGGAFGSGGLVIGAILGFVFVGGSYWFSDKIAVRAAGAVPVSEADAPQLYAIVSDLSQRAGLP